MHVEDGEVALDSSGETVYVLLHTIASSSSARVMALDSVVS